LQTFSNSIKEHILDTYAGKQLFLVASDV